VEDNEDVRTPTAMVNDKDRSTRSSKMEFVEGRRLHEGLKAWQVLYLGNEVVTVIQKLPLLHYEVTKWIHP